MASNVLTLRRSYPRETLGYSARLISCPRQIADLAPFVRTVTSDPGLLDPNVFLASLSPNEWRPWAVVVSHNRETVGVVYCKERLVAGLGTRIVIGDDALGTMTVAHPHHTHEVLRCALEALTRSMRGVRWIVPQDRLPAVNQSKRWADVDSRPTVRHAHLPMPATYEDFLAKVGSRTRRNLRYYRRKSEAAANTFVADVPCNEFCEAARALRPDSAFAKSIPLLDRHLRMIESMPSKFLVGLRNEDGKWISLAGGWCVGGQAIVLMQLNDRSYTRESISLVLRAYFIEMLIEREFREIVFWGGTTPPLSAYCVYPQLTRAFIDNRSFAWKLFRHGVSAIGRLAPHAVGSWFDWIVPVEPKETTTGQAFVAFEHNSHAPVCAEAQAVQDF